MSFGAPELRFRHFGMLARDPSSGAILDDPVEDPVEDPPCSDSLIAHSTPSSLGIARVYVVDVSSHLHRLAVRSADRLAYRAQALRSEIRELDLQICALLASTAPSTLGIFAMGPDTTAALLVAISDDADRLRSEAPSLVCVASLPSPPPPAGLCATACTGAETDQRTERCTSPSSFGCAGA